VDEIDLLKRIPKEHYTLYKGNIIRVGDLLKILSKKKKVKK